MMWRVIVTDPARDDIVGFLEWLEQRSMQGAQNWWEAYEHALKTLSASANAPESREHAIDLHEHFFKTRYGDIYRLVYMIRDETVYVLRVRATGQQLLSNDEIEVPEK